MGTDKAPAPASRESGPQPTESAKASPPEPGTPLPEGRLQPTSPPEHNAQPVEHHPPHLFLDQHWYMVSAATSRRQPLLRKPEALELFRDALRELVQQHRMRLLAWVVLPDHYHIILRPRLGTDLRRFIARLHGRTAREINRLDEEVGRQVWHNYWDSCMREEGDIWRRFNYVHYNPVKHGHASRPGGWEFSSYGYYLRIRGEEWLEDCCLRYPVMDHLRGD